MFILGMIQNRLTDPPLPKRAVGLTMFGVTTPCVEAVCPSLCLQITIFISCRHQPVQGSDISCFSAFGSCLTQT